MCCAPNIFLRFGSEADDLRGFGDLLFLLRLFVEIHEVYETDSGNDCNKRNYD